MIQETWTKKVFATIFWVATMLFHGDNLIELKQRSKRSKVWKELMEEVFFFVKFITKGPLVSNLQVTRLT